MAVDKEARVPTTCKECGQLLDVDTSRAAGAKGEEPELDWAEFCPSPDCPVKAGIDGGVGLSFPT
ncbi:MAG: hypothetical protein V9G19_09675 [Tetrasphaera sp.]